MALLPSSDPDRSLHLAIRYSCVLGVWLLVLGLLFLLVLPIMSQLRGRPMMLGAIIIGNTVLLPGILYLLLALLLVRRHRWPITALLVLASAHGLLVLLAFVIVLYAMLRTAAHDAMGYSLIVPLAIIGVALVVYGQLLFQLRRSRRTIAEAESRRGFEPISPAGIGSAPVEDTPQAPMAVLAPSDERRPLLFAFGLTGLLGAVFFIFGGFLAISATMQDNMRWAALCSLSLTTPGVAYLVLAAFLWQEKLWAVIATMGLAVVQLIMAVAAMVALRIAHMVGLFELWMIIIWIAGLVGTLVVLRWSLGAARRAAAERKRGFELVPVHCIPMAQPGPNTGASDVRKTQR